jgi:hypothetical protein
MLHSKDLADQLKLCADGQVSVEDFEEWFALNSWNVHRQQNKDLTDAVFRVEYLFSSLNDGRLEARDVRREFAELAAAVATVQPIRSEAIAPYGHADRKISPAEARDHTS